MRTELLKKINSDLKKVNLNALSIKMGLEQPTLWRIVNAKSRGSIDVWEKINDYYKRR